MTEDRIANEMSLSASAVAAVLALLGEGATVPFIARYRKERTGGLDEVQIRQIEERHLYLTELEERRATILKSIEEQGKLAPELRTKIEAAETKAVLEDLYLPYKPKRRTRAVIAREKGLEPLALLILSQGEGIPEKDAEAFVNERVGSVSEALKGARDIVCEIVAENAEVRQICRTVVFENGVLRVEPTEKGKEGRTKFEQYYEFSEALKSMPSHRFLAIRRGEKEEILRSEIESDRRLLLPEIERLMSLRSGSPYAEQLRLSIEDSYGRLIFPSIESEIRVELKMASDREAVEVFAKNLRELLLAPPMGGKSTIGIDPGIRTGCKCAALDATGKYLGTTTIYPYTSDESKAKRELLSFIASNAPYAIAVGNGTAGRETEAFVKSALEQYSGEKPVVVSVSEAGASVYSAGEVAREEFPDLDLTIRGAISIGRRLQDPLAELVKIDPKSIGVGQYQHDVHQPLLKKKLDDVVESCVNHVGVELNTASGALLEHVSGIGASVAKNIVKYRDENGKFGSRKELTKVPGLGPKTFEQCAGFLRVKGGMHPLDASAVHPERYAAVERMASDLGVSLSDLIGNEALISRIDIRGYVTEEFGEPTLRDIIDELKKPGRDPRARFETVRFDESVKTLSDLKIGMRLEGVVTNVTHFGAFVDIGVHEDGLVHVSRLSDKFVRDPSEVVSVGQRVKVWVTEIDVERQRISLSLKSSFEASASDGSKSKKGAGEKGKKGAGEKGRKKEDFGYNPFSILKDRKS